MQMNKKYKTPYYEEVEQPRPASDIEQKSHPVTDNKLINNDIEMKQDHVRTHSEGSGENYESQREMIKKIDKEEQEGKEKRDD